MPVDISLVVGGGVYALSLAGQQSLRAEIEQIKSLKGEADRRFADVDALVSRVESIDQRVSTVEKTLPPGTTVEEETSAVPSPAAPINPTSSEPVPAAPPVADQPVPAKPAQP